MASSSHVPSIEVDNAFRSISTAHRPASGALHRQAARPARVASAPPPRARTARPRRSRPARRRRPHGGDRDRDARRAWAPRSARSLPDDDDVKLGALVFDATGIEDSAGLRALYEFFHASIRSLGPSGRLVVLGTPPELPQSRPQAVAQRALEGFVRSAAKELRQGATGQLVYVAPGRRGQRRVHAALPAVRPLGLRLRPGDPDRRRRDDRPAGLGAAAGRPRRGRHRRLARHRRRDRPHAGARRRDDRRRRRPRPGRGRSPRSPTRSAAPRCCSTSPTRTRPRGSPST